MQYIPLKRNTGDKVPRSFRANHKDKRRQFKKLYVRDEKMKAGKATKPEMLQFSPHILASKENHDLILYNLEKEFIGRVRLQAEEEKRSLTITLETTNPELFHDKILAEFLFFQILGFSSTGVDLFSIRGLIVKKEICEVTESNISRMLDDHIQLFFKTNPEGMAYEITGKILNPEITHYVQQAYLRSFSSNRRQWRNTGKIQKARIFCFDKVTQKLVNQGNTESERRFGSRISSIAQKGHFYTLYFELFMRYTIERETPPVLAKVRRNTSFKDLTENERKTLVEFVILQWERTEVARDHIRESHEKGLKSFAMLFYKDTDKEAEIEKCHVVLSEEYLRHIHEEQITDILKGEYGFDLITHLLSRRWKLIVANKQSFFFTSDNPVIFHNSYQERLVKLKGIDRIREEEKQIVEESNKKVRGYIMIDSALETGHAPAMPGVEIYLPISPKLCLCIFDSPRAKDTLSIGGINREIIRQSRRYVFSHSTNLDYLKKVIMDYPDCIKEKTENVAVELVFIPEMEKE